MLDTVITTSTPSIDSTISDQRKYTFNAVFDRTKSVDDNIASSEKLRTYLFGELTPVTTPSE